jgi:biotin carboxylase
MTGAPAQDGPPARRLAFVYHPRSFGTLAIAQAARERCDLVWVIDGEMPEVASMARLLRRLGEVVDIAGCAVDEAAERLRECRPDGILALADPLLRWTADVAARLELPFASPQAALNLTDKHAQRVALRAGGLPVPEFRPIPPVADDEGWAALAAQARFPALVKPRSGEGSRDVFAVNSVAQAREYVAELERTDGPGVPALVLEAYLPDRPADAGSPFAGYVSVESLVARGRVSHVAITGRFPLAEPFRETGFFIPSALGEEDRAAVLEAAGAAIAAVGMSVGCLHTEIKLTPDGPRVIEVNGRIGGGVPEMLAEGAGVDLLGLAIRAALGEAVGFDAMPTCAAVGYLFYVQAPAWMRRVTAVDGLEALRADPRVHEVILNRGLGQDVDWREGNHGHVFSVRGAVANHEELTVLARRVHTETRIHGE